MTEILNRISGETVYVVINAYLFNALSTVP